MANATNVVVKPVLTKIGEQSPYFSITATVYETIRGIRREVSCGACHEEIESAYPGQYTDLIALHLSDINGVPMYAVENGYYFVQLVRGDKPQDQYSNYTIGTVMRHLRIDEAEAEKVMKLDRNEFIQYCEDQKPRWKQEADTAIAKYNLKIVAR